MLPIKVLIIEDNKRLAATIRDKLRKEYVVDVAYTGDKGEYLIHANEYDIILLDLNLPDMDGAEVCKKVQTLDMGADDYLTKAHRPLVLKELIGQRAG